MGRRYSLVVLEGLRPFLRAQRGRGRSLWKAGGGCWGGRILRGVGVRQGVGQSTGRLGSSQGLSGLGSSEISVSGGIDERLGHSCWRRRGRRG